MMRAFILCSALSCAMWCLAGTRVVDLGGEGWTCDGEAVSVPHTWNAADACDGASLIADVRDGAETFKVACLDPSEESLRVKALWSFVS